MKILSSTNFLLAVASMLVFASCSKEQAPAVNPSSQQQKVATESTIGVSENFDTGTKGAYATGTVNLSSGSWTFTDALLGNLATDVKNGTQSARVRNSGKLTMNFDNANGASTVTVQHAKFGSDGNSTWQLWYSTNGGSSYSQAGGTITTSSSTFQTATFTINQAGNIRFEIRKTDGTSNRINFDDFVVYNNGTDTVTNPGGGAKGKRFLFDATKAETAGNADWVIDEDNNIPQRFPTPAQSMVTASTPETYWTGALSSWGIALVKGGHTVETLPAGGAITYGNASNPQDLSNYDVFVVDEPNILFTAAEKTAILNFVSHGGGLFMISDHTISDRNNDGYDSPVIWNDLMTNNSVQANPFGFSIDLTNITELSSNVLTNSSSNPILNGSQGSVSQLDFHNGATITIDPSVNATVQGLIWQNGYAQGYTHLMSASSTFGAGRVYVVTDSSPMDDGTGAPGNNLYVSWSTYSHTALFMNASYWLAKLQ
ncbi:hydrolase [Chitinophaga vietnamensis]|uniref:hydrolase n=1 Tax=Chitinophaga vietnamensis TaxID=2593957 RepID=UPI00117782C7|nr:hydrolase [Chitinophaga vietnamensis]